MQNDETEKFERLLRRQSLQQVPADWREEILSVAKAAQPLVAQVSKPAVSPISKSANHTTVDALRTEKSALQFMTRQLSALFWPHPVAWAGLAAVWFFIFTLNFSIRDKVPALAEKTSPPSPMVIAALRQQQRLFAELLGVHDSVDADRQKIFVPRPHSERIEILTA